MVTDAGRDTTQTREISAQSVQKKEAPSENLGFNGKTVWKFQTQIKSKIPVLAWRTKQRNDNNPKEKLNMTHVARKKLIVAKLKKAFSFKLLELCKTRNKESSPDLFNFYVV